MVETIFIVSIGLCTGFITFLLLSMYLDKRAYKKVLEERLRNTLFVYDEPVRLRSVEEIEIAAGIDWASANEEFESLCNIYNIKLEREEDGDV